MSDMREMASFIALALFVALMAYGCVQLLLALASVLTTVLVIVQ